MSMLEDVAIFHAAMRFFPHNVQEVSQADVNDKRKKIMREEIEEFSEAIDQNDRAKILHEGMDALYTIFGALHEQGFTETEIEAAWGLVHAANMGKMAPPDPLGKAGKPEGWEPADVSKALGVQSSTKKYLVAFGRGGEISNVMFELQGKLTHTSILNMEEKLDRATIISITELES